MNLAITHSSTAVTTMSSRDIADLTGSTHDSVLKTIRRLMAEGIVSGNETPYKHPQNGQFYPEFLLDFRNTMVVVSGYSAELRARIIDRWQELEKQAAGHDPVAALVSAPKSEILRLALAQQEQLEQQQALIEQQKPAVEFVGRFVDSTGSKGIREVAKLLRANEREFIAFLTDSQIMYRLGGRLTPYAQHLDAGRFEVKAGVAQNEHAYTTARFTAKGIQWIAGLWIANQTGGKA